MTNRNATKKALLSSVLALVLCFSMLLGTTFAWFTDSVTSAGNIIKSGKLEIGMYWANGAEAVPTEDSGWTDASGGPLYTEEQLWEPGYVDVKHIKIANEGTLALKYQLMLTPTDEVSILADVIDVYFIDPAVQVADRTALTDTYKLGTLREVIDGLDDATYGNGTLEAGQSVSITLALKMQETAGNEYQDMGIGSEFALKLLATQVDFESDSFDDQYDAGLTPMEDGDILVEKDGIQYLYTADGEVILYLVTTAYTSDTVVVPEGVTAIGSYSFYYNRGIKTVTLSSTVKTLNDRAFRGTSAETIVLNEGLETINYQAFRDASSLTSITFPSTLTTIGVAAFQLSGLTSVTLPASVTTLAEGAFRDMPNLTTVTIDGNPAIANYAFRSCPSLEDVYLLGDDVTFTGTSQVFSIADTGVTTGITVYVVNETVKERLDAANAADLVIIVNNTGIIEVSAKHFQVINKVGLMGLGAKLAASSPSEANILTVDLMADIDLSGETWAPIESMWVIFNGNGHTISNINCGKDGYVGRSGFWGYAGAVTMNDLTLKNVTSCGTQAGTFAGSAEGLKLNNCKLEGANSVTWEQNPAGSAYFETWNGVGAITGVTTASTINVEITAGTTVTVVKTGMTTEAPYVDQYTGYIQANNGTVTDNGTVTVVE